VIFEPALSAVLPRAAEFPVATPSGSANSLGPITPSRRDPASGRNDVLNVYTRPDRVNQ
jgi:hypothetical protein